MNLESGSMRIGFSAGSVKSACDGNDDFGQFLLVSLLIRLRGIAVSAHCNLQ
jgi:hypothetical protein